jgi:hypothetical protein
MGDRSEPYSGEPSRDADARDHARDADARDRDDGRDNQGRFLPERSGNPATQWGPERRPPKSPGRPKRSAWVAELEQRLREEPRLGQALADRVLKIALKGKDADALRAIQEIEDRTGGPLKLKVNGLSESELKARLVIMFRLLAERLPVEHHQAISDAAYDALVAIEERSR